MVAQRIGCIAWGALPTGVMGRRKILNFVPLHQLSTKQSAKLLLWLKSVSMWVRVSEPQWLIHKRPWHLWGDINPYGFWSPRGTEVCLLCTSPLAITDVYVKELHYTYMKTQKSLHVFVCLCVSVCVVLLFLLEGAWHMCQLSFPNPLEDYTFAVSHVYE